MRNKIEFLFAHWAVPYLKNVRGSGWRDLVQRVAKLQSDDSDALAFALMMVRLNGCGTCDAKRFRERGGCASCSRFVLNTLSKESEAELLDRFRVAKKEVTKVLREERFRREESGERLAA